MANLPAAVDRFLQAKRIAIVGVSRDPQQAANYVYRKLLSSGYEVFAVNPNASQVEGDVCYASLRAIPTKPEAVMIVTPPNVAAQIVRDCVDLGISQIWLHRSFGEGSVSEEAISEGKRLGLSCIVGGCPMMYCQPVDLGHRCMRWILQLQHRVPA